VNELITTHVLNTVTGQPASGIKVVLEYRGSPTEPWTILGQSKTDANGRIGDLLPGNWPGKPGSYCLRFDSATLSQFFPEIAVHFVVSNPQQNYHIPLLLSEFGYTTYRGS
jgi:5-hydroxyisourate hydrolase